MRFPEFTEEWKNTSLGKIGKTFNGLTGKSGSDFGQGFPYITYKSIFDNSKIDISRVEYVEITDAERKKKTQNEVQYGDIFFTTSSETPDEVGMTSVLLDEVNDCYLNSFCFGYRLNSLLDTMPEYMRFYLRSWTIRKKMFVLAQGSTRFNISKNEVMGMSINIPKVEEQRKIANLLILLEDRIATQIKIIDKLESLIRGISLHILAKPANTFIKDCLICNTSALQENQVAESGEYPVFGATGVRGYLNTPQVQQDAILIIKDGASVGTVKYAIGKYGVIGTLNYLTPKNDYNLKYLYYCLRIFNFTPFITGLAIPHIYFRDYGNAKVYCPSIEEQQHIAKNFSNIEYKIAIEKQVLEKLREQKNYLLSQMFI